MRIRRRHIPRGLAVAFVAAAVAVPVAQAGGPDDRPAYRGSSPALAPGGPDDRAFYRGTSDTLAPSAVSPDDRPFSRSVRVTAPAPVQVQVRPRGFDWGDAAIGGAFGLGLALLGAGAILIARRRGALTAA